jgi:hypothetical protein
LGVVFAKRYVTALDAHLNGDATTASWDVACRAAGSVSGQSQARSTSGRSDLLAVDLLAGDVGRDLRLQVHVDYVQSVPAGQVELHVQDGPLETYRDDAVH